MKIQKVILTFAFLCSALSLSAVDKLVAGPRGGRLLDIAPLKAEFFVNAQRQAEVTFYDASLKPVAPSDQGVTLTAETVSGKTVLQMEKTATGFLSKTALPAGEPYRVVLQVRGSPEAKPKNFRVDFNLAPCHECQLAEYACTCEAH